MGGFPQGKRAGNGKKNLLIFHNFRSFSQGKGAGNLGTGGIFENLNAGTGQGRSQSGTRRIPGGDREDLRRNRDSSQGIIPKKIPPNPPETPNPSLRAPRSPQLSRLSAAGSASSRRSPFRTATWRRAAFYALHCCSRQPARFRTATWRQ